MFRLWILVILCFVLLLAAWTSLIWIAAKHSPEVIRVEKTNHR